MGNEDYSKYSPSSSQQLFELRLQSVSMHRESSPKYNIYVLSEDISY